MRYALLSYKTTNLGDEIQSIAAEQFLPSVDVLVDRDRLNELPPGGPCKIILNGWHTHRPENWPPSEMLDPLFVSFHITDEVHRASVSRLRPTKVLLKGKNLAYLRAHAPIGTRDLWTRDLLQKHDVGAYFTGCLTLTLGAEQAVPREDYICAVDLSPAMLEHLRSMTRAPIVPVTHEYPSEADFAERSARARKLLSIYAHAKCVVTTRLHCALPCVALGTPVLFVITARDTYRFSGLTDFVRFCNKQEFFRGKFEFDIDNPSPNSGSHTRYRRELIRAANRFVGGDAANLETLLHPFVPERDPQKLIAAITGKATSSHDDAGNEARKRRAG